MTTSFCAATKEFYVWKAVNVNKDLDKFLLILKKLISFFKKMGRRKSTQSLRSKVLSRIYGHQRGWVFTPYEFRRLGESRAVGVELAELTKRGTIRRLGRGLYDYPETHPVLGVLTPAPDAVARAIAGKAAIRLQPCGSYAANLLGLSEQVPARITFYTEGASKKVRAGNQVIELKHTTPRNIATSGRLSGLVIEALRFLGHSHVDDTVIAMLRRKLNVSEKQQLLADISFAPAWIAQHIRTIASND